MAANYSQNPGQNSGPAFQNPPPYNPGHHAEAYLNPPPGPHGYQPVPLAPQAPALHTAYPAPGAYGPPGAHAPPVARATAAPIAMVRQMGPQSTRTICPHCNHDVSTRVESETTSKTHLIALVLCLLGCWCCCCIPYCMDSCQNINHYCPSCQAFLGTYKS